VTAVAEEHAVRVVYLALRTASSLDAWFASVVDAAATFLRSRLDTAGAWVARERDALRVVRAHVPGMPPTQAATWIESMLQRSPAGVRHMYFGSGHVAQGREQARLLDEDWYRTVLHAQ
jgi:hypothetical protein